MAPAARIILGSLSSINLKELLNHKRYSHYLTIPFI